MSYRFTILGCGSSGGVPRIGNNWGNCDALNPKNRRLRCSGLFEKISKSGTTAVLADTSPDLRAQILASGIMALDGVVYTHDHADHTHGIDDLRMVAFAMKHRVNVYFDAATGRSLKERFQYCFETPSGSNYNPILIGHEIDAAKPFKISGAGGTMTVTPIPQIHGDIASLGFRVGNLAYCPDVNAIPEMSVPLLEGLDVWVVDALRSTPHESHFSVREAVSWTERLNPKRTILTHMTGELDYATLKAKLPDGIEPAYDGMQIAFS